MRTLLASMSLALLAACASNPTPPVAPEPVVAPAPVPAPAPQPPKAGDEPTITDVVIDDAIRVKCGITDAEAHFAYDSAKLRADDSALIQKLADCFSSGPLKGSSMHLVGHADPRGEAEYNMALGGQRADSLKAAIVSARLDEKFIVTTSRGALNATGTDEASWQRDRRVEVLLAN